VIPYAFVRSPSTFPPQSRPIYVYPIAEVKRANNESAYPILARGVDEVAKKHPDSRILVHTVSYDLARYLVANCEKHAKQRAISYESAKDRQRAIDRYLNSPRSILIASSLDRGIDLPADDCRAIVVCKVPFPNLGDKQISARLHSPRGQLWYNVKTVRSIVQSTGRGMRSADDYCESYILDKQFITMIWKKNRNLIPSWWAEALIWDRGLLFDSNGSGRIH
jgi:ATP-dependent DNA helicase DinG